MKIYVKSCKKWIEVTKKQYDDYYRDINAFRRTQQNRGSCACPVQKRYLCDMDCLTCEFRCGGNMQSLDSEPDNYENGGFSLLDRIPDSSDTEEYIADKLTLILLLERLSELMPDAQKIGELRQLGMTDSKISDELELPRTTMISRLNKVKKKLEKEFPEFF